MKRFILFIFTILYVVCLFPQKTVVVNARIETKSHIWVLDSIILNNEFTEIYWHAVSKGMTWCNNSSNIYLKDYYLVKKEDN
mgnify:CR=1 FL=1